MSLSDGSKFNVVVRRGICVVIFTIFFFFKFNGVKRNSNEYHWAVENARRVVWELSVIATRSTVRVTEACLGKSKRMTKKKKKERLETHWEADKLEQAVCDSDLS